MPQPFLNQDQSYMNLALNLAKKNIGITAGNPAVGSVLVKNGIIIATGITQENGVPHSENDAINKAGIRAKGATLYVTLEPCSHFGKTAPCVDLIIKSKISRVVIAAIDPDLRVNGKGIEKLQAAGIEVVVGILEQEAIQANQGFFTVKKLGRPFITLKLATSFDGKIADKNCQNQWITCQKSRDYSHYLRAKNDAILVGAKTVVKDNPMLDCRLPGLSKYSPQRIILSSNLNINFNSQIIQTAKSIPTHIATSNYNHQKFTELGVKIINYQDRNLNDLVRQLPKIGINNLLVEGGSIVAAEFLKAGLIDKLIWIKAPKFIGPDGLEAIAGYKIDQLADDFKFKIIRTRKIQEDFLTEFERLEPTFKII